MISFAISELMRKFVALNWNDAVQMVAESGRRTHNDKAFTWRFGFDSMWISQVQLSIKNKAMVDAPLGVMYPVLS